VPDDLLGALAANEFDALQITVGHALAAGGLPPLSLATASTECWLRKRGPKT
jgi:hypothetical protein